MGNLLARAVEPTALFRYLSGGRPPPLRVRNIYSSVEWYAVGRNVGDDAHIVPLRGVPPAEWGNVIPPRTINVPTRFPGFGSMEGIDPYIETVGACR